MIRFPPLRLKQAFSLGGMSVKDLGLRTLKKLQENELPTRAAAVAFFAMLAVVPFLTLVITITANAVPDLGAQRRVQLDQEGAAEELEETLGQLFPGDIQEIFTDQLQRIQEQPAAGLLSISILILLWTASSLFMAIISAMDRVYGTGENRPFWKLRLIAIAMTCLQAIVLVGSLVVIAIWPWLMGWLGLRDLAATLATVIQWLVIIVMVLLSFAITFYVAPNKRQRWEWITPGSLIGTVVFLLATLGFGIYVQNFANYNETYGSLGGVMALLLWFWISALVLLVAGQINVIIEDAAPAGREFPAAKE